MKIKKISTLQRIGLFLLVCLICPDISALADTDCWYYLEHGTHDYEQVDVQLPTCESDGYYMLECRQCGKTEKQVTEKSGHYWEMTESVEPTCDTDGYESYVCENCGKSDTIELPRLGHNWVDGEVLEIATCMNEGCVRTYCTICHINSNRNTPKAQHEYGDWSVTKKATDHSQGTRTKTCSVCGDEISESFYPDGTLYRGMDKSDKVVACQKKLIELGYLNDKADGVFGKKTEQAVKDFQTDAGLKSTGIAYPQTLNELSEYMKRPTKPAETQLPTAPPEPTVPAEPTATESVDQPTEFVSCTRVIDDSGVNSIHYCPYHESIIAKYDGKMKLAHTDEARLQVLDECQAEWQAELERLYDVWLECASIDDKPQIAQAKAMFSLFMQNQESMWTINYSGQPLIVKQHIIDALTSQCVDLCALTMDDTTLTHFSFTHSGTSIDAIYSYSVMWTEEGYQADYDMYNGRIKFSLLMDEEDFTSLVSLAKSLATWDGFDETNQDVLDGEGFSLHIEYADGSIVSAYGSNAFPHGYSDDKPVIVDYFLKLMEKHKIAIDE